VRPEGSSGSRNRPRIVVAKSTSASRLVGSADSLASGFRCEVCGGQVGRVKSNADYTEQSFQGSMQKCVAVTLKQPVGLIG